MEETVIELDKTWLWGDEKESTPGCSDTLTRGSEMVKLGKALRTALLEFGQRLGMGRK